MSELITVTAKTQATPYQVTLSDGTHQWQGDVATGFGGGDTAPNPESMLLGALATCTAITVSMYAKRKKWPLNNIEVSVALDASRTATKSISSVVTLQGELDDEQRQRLLEIAEKCPVYRLLTEPLTVSAALA